MKRALILLALACGGPDESTAETDTAEARKAVAPVCMACSPLSGPVGTEVTCTGVGLRRARVTIGGDSAAVAGSVTCVTARPKVFRRGPYVIGFTHSFRMAQLLEFDLAPPERDPAEVKGDAFEFMVRRFIPAVRECFKAGGFATVSNGVETGGAFLVAFEGRLFEVASDYQVLEHAEGFASVGQGWEVALSAIHAAEASGLLHRDPEGAIRCALAAAARFCTGVREPFHVIADSPAVQLEAA